MSRTVLVADNRRAALTLVATRAREAADGDLGAVLVRDSEGDDVVVSGANRSWGRKLAALELPATVAADVLESADLRPMLIDLSEGRGARNLPRAYKEIGPVMVVPVGLPKQSRGALMILKRASIGNFSESDLRLLEPFAAEARLTIAFAAARQELERGLLAKDRSRIARDLHDGVIQSLYGIGMVLEGIQTGSQTRVKNQLSGLTGSINSIIDDLRAYINDLTPSRLAKRGLGYELGLLAQEFQAGSGVMTSVKLDGGIDEIRAGLARDLVQISREALSNIAQHAAASNATISLDCSTHGVVLVITDDGLGITAGRRAHGGKGVQNISNRAHGWGGDAVFGPSGRHGTELRVSVPGRGEGHALVHAMIAFLACQLFSASAAGAIAANLVADS